ncbi:ATP-binding cassette domain-containing protein, partial [Candidatus Aerophobetes bacterium]|nr:ATP-binding cassette domain-containing protein [Candidatus Aerophobetes bacterium]
VLELVGLPPEEYIERKVDDSLSGGERKRIELAAVVALEPKLLILDEPDSGLDIVVYNELYELLDAIRNQTRSSILLITHREEAGEVADEGTLIWKGKVRAKGSFKDIMEKYCEFAERKVKCKKISCPTK